MQDMGTYIQAHRDRFLSELIDFLKIPSISAQPEYNQRVEEAAEHLAMLLKNAGADDVQILPTNGHPAVFGQKIVDPQKPTVLVYGHYDVQPAAMEDGWTRDPFAPTIEDGRIYGRGTADDKGQLFMHIKVLEFFMEQQDIPCNIKFLFEGEEEIGSVHFRELVETHKAMLQADVAFISDTPLIGTEVPSVTTRLRGFADIEIEAIGPNKDIHSGLYGGMVANPFNALCQIIAQMKNEQGQIVVPGFYDDVEAVSADERAQMAQTAMHQVNAEKLKRDLSVKELVCEAGYSLYECTVIRPTLDVCGIVGGYTGEGSKSIIPHKAIAKILMRLVPKQDPQDIQEKVARYIAEIAPKGVEVSVHKKSGGTATVTQLDSTAYRAATQAIEQIFGTSPLPVGCGGSIPSVAVFQELLGIDTILLGFGLEEDNIHSPNESFRLENFELGLKTIPLFYQHFAELKQSEK